MLVVSQRERPPCIVASAVASRQSPMTPHADVDFSAIVMQVFGDLKTRCTAPHDENSAWRQFAGIAVSARMHLTDVVRHIGTERWNDTPLALSSGKYHIVGLNIAARVRTEQIARRI